MTTPREFADRLHGQGCPVARTDEGIFVVGHEEARAVALNPETFSSAVSAHLQLPNGLDGDEHARWRGLVDSYLGPERVRAAEPEFARTAAEIVAGLRPGTVEAVMGLGASFAVRGMLRWLGWPEDLAGELVQWVKDNQAATRSGDRDATAEVARRYDAIVRGVVEPRRAPPGAYQDVTAELARDRSLGRELSVEELVSVLRNWTAGDLGSMAACVGVIAYGLANHTELQDRLSQAVSDEEYEAILNELLRIDDPFVSNRRKATRPALLGGEEIAAGEVIHVHWTGANRDPRTFESPDEPRPSENAPENLVWGIGPHACPGRGLSLMELRVFFRALLGSFAIAAGTHGTRASYPVGGWESLEITLKERS